jgi:hypothetical protein
VLPRLLELFHDSVSGLKALSLGFELLSGTTLEQAKALVDTMNERIVGVIVTKVKIGCTDEALRRFAFLAQNARSERLPLAQAEGGSALRPRETQ